MDLSQLLAGYDAKYPKGSQARKQNLESGAWKEESTATLSVKAIERWEKAVDVLPEPARTAVLNAGPSFKAYYCYGSHPKCGQPCTLGTKCPYCGTYCTRE